MSDIHAVWNTLLIPKIIVAGIGRIHRSIETEHYIHAQAGYYDHSISPGYVYKLCDDIQEISGNCEDKKRKNKKIMNECQASCQAELDKILDVIGQHIG